MYFSAFLKLLVSLPTSRWLIRQFLCGCRYSIGSSMVMMCSCRSVLILSIIAASVVDLPEPVGPVTSTSPRGLLHSSSNTGGSPRSANVRMLKGMVRNAPPTAPRCMNRLPRNRAMPRTPKEKSSSRSSSKRSFWLSVSTE